MDARGMIVKSVASEATARGEPRAARALAVAVSVLVVTYAVLFATGTRFLIVKTAVMPIFVAYGLLLTDRIGFLADWLPLLGATVLFDAGRGAIFVAVQRRYLPVFASYVITLERAVLGTPAVSVVLQRWRTPAFDTAAVLVHASHFLFFLLFGLVVWHFRREHFGRYRRAMLLVMALGLLGYVILPTVPPWLAYEQFHLLPPITHIVEQVYTRHVAELYGSFDTNPVAAMPSLHAAFPVACAWVGWKAFGRGVGLGLALYAVAVMLAVMYLGEHYAIDVIAGIAVGIGAGYASWRPWTDALSFRKSLALSAGALAATFVLLLASR